MDPKVIAQDFLNILQNHYFDMKGRVRRHDFWTFMLGGFVVFAVVSILTGLFLPNRMDSILNAVIVLALLPPLAGMGARRLQDTGRDGRLVWALVVPMGLAQIDTIVSKLSNPYGPSYYDFFPTLLVQLVGFVALVALVYFWVQDGTAGPNPYGADTKLRKTS